MSAYGVLALIVMIAVGGYAVDVSNVITRRTHLQITADAVAHAALVEREFGTVAAARTKALALSTANLPIADVGAVVNAEDIVFGDWSADGKTFTPRANSRTAVRVVAREHSDTGNPVKTFMLKIVGMDDWDVTVVSSFQTYHPSCLREGFVAESVVDVQSNNTFREGFCIHSNTGVKLSSNNTFEPGTVVSMADLDTLQIPNSGYRTNVGLSEALREGSWNIRIVARINEVIQGLQDPNSKFYPTYLTSPTPVTFNDERISQSDLIPGRIHKYTCTGGKSMVFDKDVLVNNVVIVTNCKIKFNQGMVITSAAIATTDTSSLSMTSPSDFQLGQSDGCQPGGEAQLVTMGSIKLSAKISIFGSQLLAAKDIAFTALGDGSKGVQMVAGGTISGTSNMDMGACGNMENSNLQVNYFKLVE